MSLLSGLNDFPPFLGVLDCIKTSSSNHFKAQGGSWGIIPQKESYPSRLERNLPFPVPPLQCEPVCLAETGEKIFIPILQAADLLYQLFSLSLSFTLRFRISLLPAVALFSSRPCSASFRELMFRAIFFFFLVLRRGLYSTIQHM